MARLSICFRLMLILSCGTICSSALTTFSLEDKLKELELRLEDKIEAKNTQLEDKMTQLEAQLEINNELRQELALKVKQLEAKNVQLEVKIQDQERILTSLLQAAELPFSTDSKLFPIKKEISIRSTGKSGIPRTCRELHATDPSLPSGKHWIDPDGQGVGDNPIYVYCDMTSGSTSILHDSESSLNVGHCADAGCYSHSINYNSSMGQIKALIELSSECHQSIRYDCYYTPFELNGVAYSWWNDREGNAQYFWAGSNTDGVHTCQCGIDGNCVDPAAKCNCDALAPLQLVDDGVITDKNVLPVTRLNFGRTQLETSSGVHTLIGRLLCTGSVTFSGLPKSCQDLWLIGHTLNGFYFVMGSAMMESVYCDFTKLPSDAGFQKWIGNADVKSTPVHFYVTRYSSFDTQLTPIPFDLARVNEGNAMNLTSGIFTAPRPGIYFFSFTGHTHLRSSSLAWFTSHLFLNGNEIGTSWVQENKGPVDQLNPLTLQSTLNLKEGDQVWVMIEYSSGSSSYLIDGGNHHTHFTGFVLEEEIVASL